MVAQINSLRCYQVRTSKFKATKNSPDGAPFPRLYNPELEVFSVSLGPVARHRNSQHGLVHGLSVHSNGNRFRHHTAPDLNRSPSSTNNSLSNFDFEHTYHSTDNNCNCHSSPTRSFAFSSCHNCTAFSKPSSQATMLFRRSRLQGRLCNVDRILLHLGSIR